jgi:multisubunit Na+/H+ antiporter MnhE subunit
MTSRRASRTVLAWAGWWIVLAALYAVLADNPALPEAATGAVAAAIGATGAVLVRRERHLLLRPRARWLRGAWRPLAGLITDVLPLTRALVRTGVMRRPSRGALAEIPFDATGDDPEAAAFRALTETLGSLAPNTIVVSVDHERGTLLVHQLEPTRDPAAAAVPLRR